MSSRPRRSAATKANEVISVHARWADSPERSDSRERSVMSSRRSGRASGVSRDARSPDDNVTVKVASNRLRETSRGGGRRGTQFAGGEIVEGKRNRGVKKSYVVDSSPDEDEDEEEEEEAEIEVEEEDDDDDDDDDDDMDVDEDAEGEDDMDVDAEGEDIDAEGEEDADGDMDVDLVPAPPTIKVSKPPTRGKPLPRPSASKVILGDEEDDDDDDDDLSDPADSDDGNDQTLGFGDDTMADEDAEGEEIEVAGEEIDEEEGPADSDDEDADGEEPDLTKMTKRQRARFEGDENQEYMKLSDEVQVKKHFTAEELSMRRQEMARRRRNLSEKRNEEVKMETINKLLKKQAPKINRKAAAAAAAADTPDDESQKASPMMIRWVSNKKGSRIGVPEEIMQGPNATPFVPNRGLGSGRMVEEVA